MTVARERDHERLRSMLLEGVAPLIEFAAQTAADFADIDVLRDLAAEGADVLLSYPPGQVPTVLPPGLTAKLDELPLTGPTVDSVSDETRRGVIHDAFTYAGRYVTERAFANGINKNALQHWLAVLQAMERLVYEYRAQSVTGQRLLEAELQRYASARLLQSIVWDPVVDLIVAASLRALDTEPRFIPEAPRPPWLDDADSRLTMLVARRLGRVVAGPPVDVARLPHDGIAAASAQETIVLVPTEQAVAARQRLRNAMPGAVVAVGLPGSSGELNRSLSWCRRALELYQRDQLERASSDGDEERDVVYCAELLPELLIAADESLLHRAAADLLSPLQSLTAHRRAVLVETLRAWSRRPNAGAPAIGAHLGVHPQTIRYRLRQLREIYGEMLDDERRMFLASIVLHLPGSTTVRSDRSFFDRPATVGDVSRHSGEQTTGQVGDDVVELPRLLDDERAVDRRLDV